MLPEGRMPALYKELPKWRGKVFAQGAMLHGNRPEFPFASRLLTNIPPVVSARDLFCICSGALVMKKRGIDCKRG
jgi:hypothetical protein